MKPPIEIVRPCTADWNAMTGDDRKRLCAQCGKHVHNLSALTPAELHEFAANRDGSECIGYVFRADGGIATASTWTPFLRWLRPLLRGPVWLLALLLPALFSGCARNPGKPVTKGHVLPGSPAPLSRTARPGTDGAMLLGEAPTMEEQKKDSRISGEAGITVGRPNPARPSQMRP